MSFDNSGRRNATHETLIGKLFETRGGKGIENQPERLPICTALVLEKRLGLGDRPRMRLALYRHIEAAQREHGPAASRIVWRTLGRCKSKEQPGHWFSIVVTGELHEAGFWYATPDC